MRFASLRSNSALIGALLVAVGLPVTGRSQIITGPPGESQVVRYGSAAEVAAARAFLLRPIEFAPGDSALTPLADWLVADQALIIAENPGLHVTVAVSPWDSSGVARPELGAARMRTLLRAYEAEGVTPDQISFTASSLGAVAYTYPPESANAPLDTGVIASLVGPLAYGVAQVEFKVRAWPGAEVFVLPKPLVDRSPSILCDAPTLARIGFAAQDGTLSSRYPRRAVVVMGRDSTRMVYRPHDIGKPPLDEPVDLSVLSNVPFCGGSD